ncbi:MAG: hypothetical protein JWP89_537 [Schlesneria sp.]|nr:hypothetical protein [Schlesneria sp.]
MVTSLLFSRRTFLMLFAGLLILAVSAPASADVFTVKEDDGNKVTVEARLIGEGQGVMAIERTDGRIEAIPQDQILQRVPGPDPTPLSCAEVLERLTERFGKDRFRGHSDSTYVIGLVLAEPLPKQYDAKATAMLKKAARFMTLVEKVFLDFVDDLKIEIVKPRYPLVLLIFETDDDFIKFTAEQTGGRGLSAQNILGYYSVLTNHLVIRMSECHTFETPLHEAIHQQVYNRGILQRLSPSPAWFNEGIATGFEGTGEKINSGPLKLNTRYARGAMRARTVNWDEVVANDRAFRGDVLAGEAYAHAWSIHWFLATKYRKQYIEYLQLLSQKQPLQRDDSQTRVDDFERIFGKRVGKLQSEFPQAIESAAKKQKVSLETPKPPGYMLRQINLAEVEMSAARVNNGTMQAEGRMRNLSLLRPMSFYVTVETDAGTYADWYLPNVAPQKEMPLAKQFAQKQMQNAPGGPSQTFVVKVRAAVADSDTALQWQRGQLPAPVYRD